MPLEGLTTTFHADEGFSFTSTGWSSSFSVLWTDEPVTTIGYYLEGVGTNGLREFVPETAKGMCVSFMGTKETSDFNANLIYIITYDGEGSRPEVDNRLGFRYTNWVTTDLSQECTIEVKADDELGYVVSVNGVEYRTGLRGEETYDIDMTGLLDVEEGYFGIGCESAEEGYANFTLSTINGKSAGSYFD